MVSSMKVVLLFLAALSAAHAGLPSEMEINGRKYTNIVYRSHDASRVIFSDDSGRSFFLLSELPPELQKEFNYDPVAAAKLETDSVAAQDEAQHRLGVFVAPPVRLPQQQQVLDILQAADFSPLMGKDESITLFFDFKEQGQHLTMGVFVRTKRETPLPRDQLRKLEELGLPIITALNERLKGTIKPINNSELAFAEQPSCNFFVTTYCRTYYIPIHFRDK